MQLLHLGARSVLTSTEIAGLVLQLATELALADGAELVEFPAMDEHGDVIRVQLVLSSGNLVWATTALGDDGVLEEPATTTMLRTRIDALAARRTQAKFRPAPTMLDPLDY